MEERTQVVPVELEGGRIIYVEAAILGGPQDIAINIFPFEEVAEVIEGVSRSIIRTIEKVKPRKATVEFGLQISIESGKLTAVLVKGTGTATLKVVFEWSPG